MKSINVPYEDLRKVNSKYINSLIQVSTDVITSGWYILGNQVAKFEEEFAKINNSKFCIGVASGLDALVLGLEVFDFPIGKKVLIPSNAYIASILAVIKAGLVPVLVEPVLGKYTISILELENAYDSDCVAIMPVHLYGRLSPMVEIVEFAKSKNLKIIEDCAQSHFAKLNGIFAGNFGEIGAFSFYPTKNLGALGDAGAIVCNDENLYFKLKALRNYGSEKKYHNKYIGLNSRLDEIQAAFLNIKLNDYQEVIFIKRTFANKYLNEILPNKYLRLPDSAEEDHVWHIFNILTPFRDELKAFLLEEGIVTEVHYPVAPQNQDGYVHLFKNAVFPISELIHAQTLSLPISSSLGYTDVDYVIHMINNFFKQK